MAMLSEKERRLYSALGVVFDNRHNWQRPTYIGDGLREVTRPEAAMLIQRGFAEEVWRFNRRAVDVANMMRAQKELRRLEVKMGIRNPEERKLEGALAKAVK